MDHSSAKKLMELPNPCSKELASFSPSHQRNQITLNLFSRVSNVTTAQKGKARLAKCCPA